MGKKSLIPFFVHFSAKIRFFKNKSDHATKPATEVAGIRLTSWESQVDEPNVEMIQYTVNLQSSSALDAGTHVIFMSLRPISSS